MGIDATTWIRVSETAYVDFAKVLSFQTVTSEIYCRRKGIAHPMKLWSGGEVVMVLSVLFMNHESWMYYHMNAKDWHELKDRLPQDRLADQQGK